MWEDAHFKTQKKRVTAFNFIYILNKYNSYFEITVKQKWTGNRLERKI